MDTLREGILGFVLFISHWFFPDTGRASLDADILKMDHPDTVVVRCKMDMAWNRQLEKLVDAGIPLRFRISTFTDKNDTIEFYRTLTYDMIDFTYFVTDSSSQVNKTQEYPMVLLAIRDFSRWEIRLAKYLANCRVEASIMPARAEQLDRLVDMSRVWGQQKVSYEFNLQKMLEKKKRR